MKQVKRFIAFWVVAVVTALLLGALFGIFEITTAPKIDGEWCGMFSGICSRNKFDIFGMLSMYLGFWVFLAYPVFRTIVGSFKLVFSRRNEE